MDLAKLKLSATYRRDSRGELFALQSYREIPFEIRRVFYVKFPASGTIRGEHAHRECFQALFVVRGSFRITIDNALNSSTEIYNEDQNGLLIPPMIWSVEESLHPHSVLLILASAEYDEDDYIRERTEFEALIAEKIE